MKTVVILFGALHLLTPLGCLAAGLSSLAPGKNEIQFDHEGITEG